MEIPEVKLFTFIHEYVLRFHFSQCRTLTLRSSVYPLVDPNTHFTSKTFKDQVVIISGGSKGIGATTALYYAKAGAKLVLVARKIKDLEDRKTSIEEEVSGAEVAVVAGDISDLEVSKRAVQTAVQKWNRVDIVVANSGIGQGGPESMSQFACGQPLPASYADVVLQSFTRRIHWFGGTLRRST